MPFLEAPALPQATLIGSAADYSSDFSHKVLSNIPTSPTILQFIRSINPNSLTTSSNSVSISSPTDSKHNDELVNVDCTPLQSPRDGVNETCKNSSSSADSSPRIVLYSPDQLVAVAPVTACTSSSSIQYENNNHNHNNSNTKTNIAIFVNFQCITCDLFICASCRQACCVGHKVVVATHSCQPNICECGATASNASSKRQCKCSNSPHQPCNFQSHINNINNIIMSNDHIHAAAIKTAQTTPESASPRRLRLTSSTTTSTSSKKPTPYHHANGAKAGKNRAVLPAEDGEACAPKCLLM